MFTALTLTNVQKEQSKNNTTGIIVGIGLSNQFEKVRLQKIFDKKIRSAVRYLHINR